MEKKTFKKGKEKETKVEGEVKFSTAVPAEVKELLGRSGRGDITQVLCLISDGRDKNKTLRRNVRGPVRLGDILMLTETEIEAQRIGGGRRGGRKK
jgi:small subunit ribosomal protein S28e